jgi:hypothetical protein
MSHFGKLARFSARSTRASQKEADSMLALPRKIAPLAAAILTIIIGYAIPVPALAARCAPQPPTSLQQAVDACRTQARTESYAPFDAYVNALGGVEVIGIEWARFQFRKCMTLAGHPID